MNATEWFFSLKMWLRFGGLSHTNKMVDTCDTKDV